MFKVMYVRTRSGNPYLHTYRTNAGQIEFGRVEAYRIADRVHDQHGNLRGTDVAIVPANQDCPDYCPLCGVNLAADGYPLGHQDDNGEPCPITWGRNAV